MQFLLSGGEMGRLMRGKNWSETSLGAPQFWPQSLRTTLSILLNSKFPMFLFWEKELICFYNDAYRPSLGKDGKHPSILGMKGEEAWSEIWHIIKPLIDQVLAGGEATWSEDQLIPIYRNGKIEDVYWTFSYSPVHNELGEPAGVFVTCNETTNNISTLKSLRESEERFRAMADNIPNLAWMADADGWIYWYNKRWYEYTGTTCEQMEGWGWQSVHDSIELPHVLELWNKSIATGEEFEMIFPLKSADDKFNQFLTRVSPVKDSEGKIQQWFGTNTDIAKQKEIEDALQESKDQLEFAIEATELGTWDYNPLTNKFYSNARVKKWFGMEAEDEILLTHAINAMLERDRQRVTSAIQKALEFSSGGNYDIEYTIVNAVSKKETIVHAKGRAWFNDENTAYRFNGTLEDITARAMAAKKMKESEDRFHNLIYSSPSAIGILYGEDLVITIANDAIIAMWGKGKEIIGKGYFEALPELAEQGYKKVFANVYKTGVPFNAVETPVNILQNGVMTLRYYNFLLFPQRKITGEIDGIGIIATEVTTQALLNNKIKESEKQFRLLADSMPQFIWTSDPAGNLNYYNQSVFDYSGLSLEQINKDGWIQIVHPDDRERNIKKWIQSIKTGNDFLIEHRFRKNTGEYRWQLSRAIAHKDENGKIQLWVGTSTDIQDQKTFADELENQVQQRTKELAENNIELEKMNKELQSFTYISSHDLQEPLRKIQTFASRLIEKEQISLTGNGKEMLERMQDAALRMQTLIDDLLAYSRTNTADRKYEITHLKIIVDKVKEDLKEELQQKNAIIEASELCEANIIPFQFRQLLNNLISNSLKFSNPKQSPHIKIKSNIAKGKELNNDKLSEQTKYCHIKISDNGIGFEQEFSDKIFELFQRLHGKKEYKGTGIGLAIVKKIVENHQGIISANGEINKGATFNIYLPAT